MTRKFASPRLVVATHNRGKLEEISALLAPFAVSVVSAGDLGLPEPEETESTFIGNARIKAHAAAQATGLPALSDDSGITVDGRDFVMAMTRTWNKLEALNAPSPRLAQFRCTLVLAWPDGHDEVFEGCVEGQVTWPMRGELGHGYDPIFVPKGHLVTFGEMDRWEKNQMSHRADAFNKLVKGCFE
jgi:XTP/dITP diphosphohydrolase